MTITEAIDHLRTTGQAISANQVYRLVRGSRPQFLAQWKAARDEEASMSMSTATVPVSVGLITQAQQAVQEAEACYHNAVHEQTLTQRVLRELEHDPDTLTGTEYAERQAQRHNASGALHRQQAQVQAAQRAVRDAAQQVARLQARAGELPALIAWLEGEVGPQGQLAQQIVKWEAQLQSFNAQLVQKRQEIVSLQDELRTLTGAAAS